MTRTAAALAMTLATLAAACMAGCGEEPLTNLIRNCEPPADTLPFDFLVGDDRIAGFIDPPPGPGPHPAVVLIHDDGPTDVTRGVGDFKALREAFDRASIASVVWDKAGSGCSGGRYAGLADLFRRADEVVAAVDALRARSGIDAERVGAWALGQGGWVAPMAAVRTGGLAYLILVSPPGGDPIDQRLYLIEKNLALEGYPKDEVDRLVGALRTALDAMADQASYQDYAALIRPVADHPFMETLMDLTSDILPTARRYDELRGSGALDVSADVFLSAVDVPVLAIWGSLDSQVDLQAAQDVYRQAFGRRASDLTIAVFEDADHRLCEARSGSLDEARSRGRCAVAQGYIETMLEWLEQREFAATGVSAGSAESALTNAQRNGADRR